VAFWYGKPSLFKYEGLPQPAGDFAGIHSAESGSFQLGEIKVRTTMDGIASVKHLL
jgi:hypothetical protein